MLVLAPLKGDTHDTIRWKGRTWILHCRSRFTAQRGSYIYQDVTYIYNFVPETDQKEVLELMESKSDQTFFTGYAPDPYTLTDLKRYEEILPLKQNDKSANSKVKKQKPFHFFRR